MECGFKRSDVHLRDGGQESIAVLEVPVRCIVGHADQSSYRPQGNRIGSAFV